MFRPEWEGQVCSLGYDLIDWLETYCCHGPGDVQGQPVEIDAEMATFIVRAYELDRRTGRRKIDRAVLSRPKGRAKSEIAGLIATAEAFGPVRFDGWSADGQPVGRPVLSPLIKCLATEESQAGNTFENAAFIISDWGRDQHPDIYGGASGVRQYQSATAIYLPGGGEMRASTSGSASKDGGKETFVVPDETHLYVTNELRAMYATVARNCGKRKEAEPWMLQTTTAYEEGRNSVAEQVLAAWKDGKLPNPAHWLVDHREAIGTVDLSNRRHTLEQLRYVYGAASSWMDLERIYRSMLDPTECETPEVAARYFLNIPVPRTSLGGGIFDPGVWEAAADPGSAIEGRPFLAVAMTPGRSTVTLSAAGKRTDGQFHLETVLHGPPGGWFVEKTVEIARRQGSEVGIVPTHPAGSLLAAFEEAHVRIRTLTGSEYTQGCGALYDAVTAGTVHYLPPQPELDAAVAAATQKQSGMTWRWAGDDISALVAATQAFFMASTFVPVGSGRLLMS